ncbi:unnamed protein product [Sphagnum balticum]
MSRPRSRASSFGGGGYDYDHRSLPRSVAPPPYQSEELLQVADMGQDCCRFTVWGLSITVMFFAMVLAGIGVFAPNWWYLHVNETVGGWTSQSLLAHTRKCRYEYGIHIRSVDDLSPRASVGDRLRHDTRPGITAFYYIDTSNRVGTREYVSTMGTMYFVSVAQVHLHYTSGQLQLENDYCVYCCMASSGLLFFNLLLTLPVCIMSIMKKRKMDKEMRADKYRYGTRPHCARAHLSCFAVEMHRPRSRHDDEYDGGGGVRSRSHSHSRPAPQPTQLYRDSYTQANTHSYKQPRIIVVDRPQKHSLY